MVRNAVLQDEEQVYRLICLLEQTRLPRQPFLEIFRRQLESPAYCCLVWEEQGRVEGVLNLRWEEQLHHGGKVGEILEFVLEEDCRGQGIGKIMFARACELARRNGCLQIELDSNQRRTGAHRFYLREGMENTHYKFCKPL